jgi:opacity protein-like surface antigen
MRNNDGFFTEMAIITGFGSGNLPEGNYQPILLIGHFGIDLKKYFSTLQNHSGRLAFFAEPQFNIVVKPDMNLEYGVGIKYAYPIMEGVSAYIMGSVGPHKISVVTTKQENGFIWSDVLCAGLYYHLTRNSAINVGYRFRHLSNAHFAMPNGGINTHFGIVGYSVFFDW